MSKNQSVLRVLVILILAAFGALANAESQANQRPTIVFMTDFGVRDDSVAICKGVMYSIVPDARVVDLTHQVTPFSIAEGARFLYGATPYFQAGAVFVVVVDPTVGSTRKAIVVKSKRGQFFVLPDNGLMTMVQDRDGLEAAREITNPAWMIGSARSSTFHGRDIFSPAGAHLARGDDWTQVGPELELAKLVRLDISAAKVDEKGLTGQVIATDGPFGNLVTNVSSETFFKLGYSRGQTVPITIGDKKMDIPFVRTFSDVPLKQPLLYIDSRGRLGIAVDQGSFSQIYGVVPPQPVFVPRAGQK
ncbi:MAG: SAM-dependent chlorinase/fluorinase [Acidobacteriaceae bacterium]|nr:SAM-dependent chlorinase/fluorinase [Acidobacteriaceae bacterium]